ncbi:hypothetical protein Tco_1055150 [Tanacetum coccineum]|uniref:Retrotransposon gag domain-containing protein n=1 Tax=Tanacetum coccineum TaxID=301880 RepID=A0ABQ5GYS7_9ASTR
MRELREDTFSGNKNEDTHDHVDRVLNIVSLFNIPGVSHDVVMLRVFPFTLTGAAKRLVDRLTPGAINTWELLKNAFIQRYCPPSKIAKQLEDIYNFKQEGVESLYHAWERYNNLLYKCPAHDINTHQKTMTDHSQKWHDETSSKSIGSSNNTDGLAVIVSKLDNVGRDMRKLKENVHAIQVGFQLYERAHLDKECPLSEEVKGIEKAKYGKYKNSRINHDKIIQNLESKVKTLTAEVETKVEKLEECKAILSNARTCHTPKLGLDGMSVRGRGVIIIQTQVAADGVTIINRRHRDLYSDDVRDLVTASKRGQPKETLEDFVSRD